MIEKLILKFDFVLNNERSFFGGSQKFLLFFAIRICTNEFLANPFYIFLVNAKRGIPKADEYKAKNHKRNRPA